MQENTFLCSFDTLRVVIIIITIIIIIIIDLELMREASK